MDADYIFTHLISKKDKTSRMYVGATPGKPFWTKQHQAIAIPESAARWSCQPQHPQATLPPITCKHPCSPSVALLVARRRLGGTLPLQSRP